MIFISVNTPTKTKGIGAGKASDIPHNLLLQLNRHVRTAEVIKKILESAPS